MIVALEGRQGGGGRVGSSGVVFTCSVQQHIDLVQLMLVSLIKAGGWHCSKLVQQQAPDVPLARLQHSQRPKHVCYLLRLEPTSSHQNTIASARHFPPFKHTCRIQHTDQCQVSSPLVLDNQIPPAIGPPHPTPPQTQHIALPVFQQSSKSVKAQDCG